MQAPGKRSRPNIIQTGQDDLQDESQLSEDVWRKILFHACFADGGGPPKPQHFRADVFGKCSTVCRQWREIIETGPEFWQAVSFHLHSARRLLGERPSEAQLESLAQFPWKLHLRLRSKAAWLHHIQLCTHDKANADDVLGLVLLNSLKQLPNLTGLAVTSGDFFGSSQDMQIVRWCLSELTRLQELSVDVKCSLVSLEASDFSGLSALTRLSLRTYDSLSVSVLDVIGVLPELEELELESTDAIGTIAPSFAMADAESWQTYLAAAFAQHCKERICKDGSTSKLKALHITSTDQDYLPLEVIWLTQLTRLEYHHSTYEDDRPAYHMIWKIILHPGFQSLTQLQHLHLEDAGDGLMQVAQLTQLTYLHVARNKGMRSLRGDELLQSVCTLPQLRHLGLVRCNITRLPGGLAMLTQLETLILDRNPIGSWINAPSAVMQDSADTVTAPVDAAAGKQDAAQPVDAKASVGASTAAAGQQKPDETAVTLPSSLQTISVVSCKLGCVPPIIVHWAGSRVRNEINLSNNPSLSHLPPGRWLQHIKSFILSKTAIAYLPIDLQNSCHLRVLDVRGCHKLPIEAGSRTANKQGDLQVQAAGAQPAVPNAGTDQQTDASDISNAPAVANEQAGGHVQQAGAAPASGEAVAAAGTDDSRSHAEQAGPAVTGKAEAGGDAQQASPSTTGKSDRLASTSNACGSLEHLLRAQRGRLAVGGHGQLPVRISCTINDAALLLHLGKVVKGEPRLILEAHCCYPLLEEAKNGATSRQLPPNVSVATAAHEYFYLPWIHVESSDDESQRAHDQDYGYAGSPGWCSDEGLDDDLDDGGYDDDFGYDDDEPLDDEMMEDEYDEEEEMDVPW